MRRELLYSGQVSRKQIPRGQSLVYSQLCIRKYLGYVDLSTRIVVQNHDICRKMRTVTVENRPPDRVYFTIPSRYSVLDPCSPLQQEPDDDS